MQYSLTKHRAAASISCPSLKHKRVTVHRLRHTMAMDLLEHGVDRSVIALWLGHERVETTQIYLEATLAIKEKALARTSPPNAKPGRTSSTRSAGKQGGITLNPSHASFSNHSSI